MQGPVTGRRPLLVVVNGLPGSGKSTLARPDALPLLASGLDAMLAARPGTRLVDARGEEDLTYAAFVAAVVDPGPQSGPR